MFAGLTIKTVFSIINYAIPAIKTVEQMIRGRGKGKEKRSAVVNGIRSNLLEELGELKKVNLPDFDENYRWMELALNAKGVEERIGRVVDATVDLLNFLGSFDSPPDDE